MPSDINRSGKRSNKKKNGFNKPTKNNNEKRKDLSSTCSTAASDIQDSLDDVKFFDKSCDESSTAAEETRKPTLNKINQLKNVAKFEKVIQEY